MASSSVAYALPRCSIKLKLHQMQLQNLAKEESCRRYAVAEMNNASASAIENGRYDKAISKLGKGLKILKAVDGAATSNRNCSSSTACLDCSLDGCIEYSSSSSKEQEKFHSTPIYIPERVIIREEGNRNEMVFPILRFNLALAYHLKMLKRSKNKNYKSQCSSLFQNTVKLYKIVLDAAAKDNEDGDATTESATNNSNKRFHQIVRNNLNHAKNHFLSANEEEKKKTVVGATVASLYEQHKELLRSRYCVASSIATTAETTTESSSSSSSSLILASSKEDADGFSLRLQNAMRTSSSFEHVQRRRNTRTAQAA